MTTIEAKSSPSLASARTSDLNSRRILARLIDELLLIGATLLLTHALTGLTYLVASLWLTVAYFFLFESIWGQTIGKNAFGLRVVRRDGGPPKTGAIATRNVIRIIEEPVLALLVLLGSRRRRQRIGDFAAGTTIGIERASVRPHPSRLIWLYPLIWAGLGVLLLLSVSQPQEGPARLGASPEERAEAQATETTTYLTELQALCRGRDRSIAKHPRAPVDVVRRKELAFTHRVAALPVPRSLRFIRREILKEQARLGRLIREMERAVMRAKHPQRVFQEEFVPRIQALAGRSSRAFARGGVACFS